MAQTLSPEKEKELAKKFGELEIYKDQAEDEEEIAEPVTEKDESKVEKPEKDKFMDERRQLK
jgi:hypothetical protein